MVSMCRHACGDIVRRTIFFLPSLSSRTTIGFMSLDFDVLTPLIAAARQEDLGHGDISTALLPDPDRAAAFELVARKPCVFAGREVTSAILAAYDPAVEIRWRDHAEDGAPIDNRQSTIDDHSLHFAPVALATISGPLRSILAAERVFLNFLQRLCGIATATRAFVGAVAGTRAEVYDTRKTTPGWRSLEKYAVRCGGGRNHRKGLYDAVLIKDNHLHGVPIRRLASAVFEMLNRLPAMGAKPGGTSPFVEIEAESLDQVEELFKVTGIDAILLDNFSVEHLRAAVRLRESYGLAGKIIFEASGGITLNHVRAVAETGVERISVGAITHSVPAVDLSLERVT